MLRRNAALAASFTPVCPPSLATSRITLRHERSVLLDRHRKARNPVLVYIDFRSVGDTFGGGASPGTQPTDDVAPTWYTAPVVRSAVARPTGAKMLAQQLKRML